MAKIVQVTVTLTLVSAAIDANAMLFPKKEQEVNLPVWRQYLFMYNVCQINTFFTKGKKNKTYGLNITIARLNLTHVNADHHLCHVRTSDSGERPPTSRQWKPVSQHSRCCAIITRSYIIRMDQSLFL